MQRDHERRLTDLEAWQHDARQQLDALTRQADTHAAELQLLPQRTDELHAALGENVRGELDSLRADLTNLDCHNTATDADVRDLRTQIATLQGR